MEGLRHQRNERNLNSSIDMKAGHLAASEAVKIDARNFFKDQPGKLKVFKDRNFAAEITRLAKEDNTKDLERFMKDNSEFLPTDLDLDGFESKRSFLLALVEVSGASKYVQ